MQRVRAVSLDVTGTMLVHKAGVYASYAAAAKWAGMPAAPTAEEFKPAFKKVRTDIKVILIMQRWSSSA